MNSSAFGYYVPNQWQGRFDRYIEIRQYVGNAALLQNLRSSKLSTKLRSSILYQHQNCTNPRLYHYFATVLTITLQKLQRCKPYQHKTLTILHKSKPFIKLANVLTITVKKLQRCKPYQHNIWTIQAILEQEVHKSKFKW